MNVQYNNESTDEEIPVFRDVVVMASHVCWLKMNRNCTWGEKKTANHKMYDVVIARFQVLKKKKWVCSVYASVEAPVDKHNMVLP